MTYKDIRQIFFGRKTILSKVKTDIHSHLIPGIDDGSKSLNSSIELIKSLKSLGYRRLIITPHIKQEQFPNKAEDILEKFEQLKREISKRDISIQLDIAAEYFYDNNFIELIERDELLTFGDKYLLFELSYVSPPLNLEETISTLQSKGYKPVLAHPERFIYFYKKFEKYEELKRLGIYFQLNINSLSGYYSKIVQQNAKNLINRGYIDFIGSDTHHQRHIDTLKKSINNLYYNKIFEKNNILNDDLII